MALSFMKRDSKKPAPAVPSGDPVKSDQLPPVVKPAEQLSSAQTDPAAAARQQFLFNQAAQLHSNTRLLKCQLYGATQAGEVPAELAKWLFSEFLEMAKLVEGLQE